MQGIGGNGESGVNFALTENRPSQGVGREEIHRFDNMDTSSLSGLGVRSEGKSVLSHFFCNSEENSGSCDEELQKKRAKTAFPQ